MKFLALVERESTIKKRDEVKARLSHNPEIKEDRLPFEVTVL